MEFTRSKYSTPYCVAICLLAYSQPTLACIHVILEPCADDVTTYSGN